MKYQAIFHMSCTGKVLVNHGIPGYGLTAPMAVRALLANQPLTICFNNLSRESHLLLFDQHRAFIANPFLFHDLASQ